MDNIKALKENSNDLYNQLISYDCKASYNGKTLYEGKYDENYNYNNINKSCVVLDFNLGDKHYICLENENKYIDILKESVEKYEDIYKDPKIYNKVINLSNELPLFNICEDSLINQKGDSIKKIYENLNI